MEGNGWIWVVRDSYSSLWMTADRCGVCGYLNMIMYGFKYIHINTNVWLFTSIMKITKMVYLPNTANMVYLPSSSGCAVWVGHIFSTGEDVQYKWG